MTLNATEIAAVVQELAEALAGGWIQKVFQPLPDLLVLEVRVPGRTHRVLCSVNPATARLHLIRRQLPNPPSPPAFCQLLRARRQGARLDAIRQVPGDRIVQLTMTTREGSSALVAELFGKRPDVLFLDQEGAVVATLANQKDRVDHHYEPPPSPAPPLTDDPSPATAQAPSAENSCPVSADLEDRYREREGAMAHDHALRTRDSALRKAIKKERRRLDGLHRDLDNAGRYEHYARYGELLKSNLHLVQRGQTELAVIDYYDERMPQLTLPLDPAKSAQANMDGYFSKYRKYVTAQREVVPRISALEQRIGELERELTAIKNGTWAPPPQADPQTGRGMPQRRRRLAQESRRGPFRRFISADGHQIFVGRNARENDELTFGLAKSDDVWLHAQGTPGSHVVIRLEKGTDPPPDTLRDAATLALLYSDLKKSGKGDVIYTRRKWVKKAKGQAPGAVTVTQEKALHVALDKKRLDAIKERSANTEA
ncbi:MAG: NFACT family protein [Nitrospiraceae bacterium]